MTKSQTWAVILAAGDGVRLRPLVRLLEERIVPKQFAFITGGQSLLQATVTRTTAIIPPSRTLVVVAEEHATLASRQLARWRDIEIVLQPRNLGTTPGILLPLAYIRSRDPAARVAIFPSDHYVPRREPFLDGLSAALSHCSATLLGMSADRPETGLGWIVPDLPAGPGIETVARFVEKPPHTLATELWHHGALWNSFVTVGDLKALWQLAIEHLPAHAAAFASGVDGSLRHIYDRLESADFSRAVLERASGLHIARVEGSGWTDWGTPERVFENLEGTAEMDMLLHRILDGQRRHQATAPSFRSAIHSPAISRAA
jgi:mannose-1-phosphate guanylyltransferase